MSFSSELKKELITLKTSNYNFQIYKLVGCIVMSKTILADDVLVETANEKLHSFITRTVKKYFSDVNINEKTIKKRGRLYYRTVMSKADKAALLSELGIDAVNGYDFAQDSFSGALAGAFLMSGTVTDPKSDYHMEFNCMFPMHFEFLSELLSHFKIGYGVRYSDRESIYLSDAQSIEDAISSMGAVKFAFEFMNVKIYKEIRNSSNRLANCSSANIQKTVNASLKQNKAISYIANNMGLDWLTEDLRQVALLRLMNPESSLSELLSIADFDISRSGLNRKLTKLIELSERVKEDTHE